MAIPLTLAFAGDVMLGRLVNDVIPARGFAAPWGDLGPVLAAADLFLINLECALTGETRPARDGVDKVFHFRADPAVVNTLTAGRVDFCSLANNHVEDFGVAGLLETLAVLDRAGIAHAGAGSDAAAAALPARLRTRGWRVAVVACADYPAEWAATPIGPGINYTPVSVARHDFRAVEAALAAARTDADLVIFSIHWGPNMRARPTTAFRDFARAVVAAGADIFWGHSAHVVQAVEVWHRKLILFDTGDFVDDYAVDPDLRNDLSALFLVRAKPPDVLSLDLVPVQIADRQVRLAQPPERDWVTRRITGLCREIGTPVVAGVDRVSIPVTSPSGRV